MRWQPSVGVETLSSTRSYRVHTQLAVKSSRRPIGRGRHRLRHPLWRATKASRCATTTTAGQSTRVACIAPRAETGGGDGTQVSGNRASPQCRDLENPETATDNAACNRTIGGDACTRGATHSESFATTSPSSRWGTNSTIRTCSCEDRQPGWPWPP